MGFLGVLECIHQKEGCAVGAVFGTESMLRGVEHVKVFPGVADAVGEYFKEADGLKVFYAGEFFSFGQRNEPAFFLFFGKNRFNLAKRLKATQVHYSDTPSLSHRDWWGSGQ